MENERLWRAQAALKQYFGYSAFRTGQEALLDALLSGRDALGIMPTGAGKSICYQLPAILMEGTALVISPLISLMRDQVLSLKANGVPAAYINSTLTPAQQAEALRRAANGWYKIIYVAPERLESTGFLAFASHTALSLIAVDEAHCVSQWGQDFRPSYLRIARFVAALPHRLPLGAFTATATSQVKSDILRLLEMRDPVVRTTGFDRPNLFFSVLRTASEYEKNDLLLEYLRAHPDQSGIIYCATRRAVDDVRDMLAEQGFSAARYHAGLSDEERTRSQERFRLDRTRLMVATNAFGMGIDKPDIRFVIHYHLPRDLESYYQEAGRAGRDGEPADCLLLYSGRDVHIQRYLIEHGDENELLDEAALAQKRQAALERLRQMTFYAASQQCLRRRLLNYFGEHAPLRCGNCSFCQNASQPRPAEPAREPGLPGALNELRRRIARLRQQPEHSVLPDSALREIIRLRPQTMEEFAAIEGVGERKAALYGDDFLLLIRIYRKAQQ